MIRLADIAAKVRELAAENPEHVYVFPSGTACYNVWEDEDGELVGSCIVGKALVALGIDPELFIERDVQATSVHNTLRAFEADIDWVYGPDAEWLQNVQAFQDQQLPWGKAIEEADDQ